MTRNNNFDLIRLFAALQVLIGHMRGYLGLTLFPRSVTDVIKYFPGVVIFFVVSGFLIFASFDRNRNLVQYYKNRILRIFPGMWVAFLVSATLIYTAGYSAGSPLETIKWVAEQLTIFQMHTTPGIVAYANDHPNPALWTIIVEFSFYIFVPLLFWLARKRISMTMMILIFIVASCICNYYVMGVDLRTKPLPPIWKENLLPYLFYFLFGALSYVHFDKLKKMYMGKGLYWLAGYFAYVLVVGAYFDLYDLHYYVNIYGMIGAAILSQTIIALAYTLPDLSKKLLRGNDISYGVYLYHLIIIHVFNRAGYYGNNATFFPVLLLTITAAFVSWILVEKQALKLKKATFPRFKLT